jgi:3',5'-cyclic AMP phosphodiesterase CpdA
MHTRHLFAITALVVAGLIAFRAAPRVFHHAPAASTAASDAGSLDADTPVRPRTRPRRGGMDLTFLVTADTHFGLAEKIPMPGVPEGMGVEEVHRIAIAAMNGIEGTPFPAGLGGAAGRPRGVLVAGDLAETGQRAEFARFEALYGLTGREGLLHFPVYEGAGNHDVWGGPFVQAEVARRHGARRYSWDWEDMHVVCLGEAPDDADLDWLEGDLAAAGPEVGVVLFFHYPLEGALVSHTWFGRGHYHDRLDRVLAGYHVLGIFNGHYHTSGMYRWRGRDGYLEGSVKHAWHSFAVVHVTDTRFTVASYNYDRRAFWWWHDKPVFGAPGQEKRWFADGSALVGRP